MRALYLLPLLSLAAMSQPLVVDTPPLRPVDSDTPYASPRDAARHRLQTAFSDLQTRRDVPAGVRGFADALARDPSYALAAYDFGVLSAVAGHWDDAVSALEETVRLDAAGLGAGLAPQIERLRLIASLEKTPEGQLRRRYDEALYPMLDRLAKMTSADAMAALSEVGKIDPNRWEAPALLAGLNGNGHSYDIAAKFLKIAIANAGKEPAVKSALEKASAAAERELRYSAARSAAELAADRGEHEKAAELFESAWTAVPARASNGLDAAAECLLLDDTARAAALLHRLRASADPQFMESAGAMLKHLAAVEPAAQAPPPDVPAFYRDPGSRVPVRIGDLIPPVDRSRMEVLARPLPKLQPDPDPVVLLASLSADPAEQTQAALPALAEPVIRFENAWRDIHAAAAPVPQVPKPAPPVENVDASGKSRLAQALLVSSDPPGAKISLEAPDALCQTPCSIRLARGTHSLRLALPGYQDQERTVTIGAAPPPELAVPLPQQRGSVAIEGAPGAVIAVNGQQLSVQPPVELALAPGLYNISVAGQQRPLIVKPAARLRLKFGN
jgi:tetratricopeptide (TPR) repeat protein